MCERSSETAAHTKSGLFCEKIVRYGHKKKIHDLKILHQHSKDQVTRKMTVQQGALRVTLKTICVIVCPIITGSLTLH